MSTPGVLTRFPSELLLNLTLRDLRGQYKRSVLGWSWSAINPLVALLVYSIVFSTFLRIEPSVGDPSGLNSYPFFLLVALLPWQFHAVGLTRVSTSLVENQGLITKVYFPRAVLPASIVLSSLVTFAIEMGVLAFIMVVFRVNFVLPWIPVLIAVMLIQAAFLLGLGLMLSVANVYFRDVQYFLSVALQPWFFLTPIIYPITLVQDNDGEFLGIAYKTLYELNPMVSFVESYRDILYDLRAPSLGRWAAMLGIAAVALVLGSLMFRKLEPAMAEEI